MHTFESIRKLIHLRRLDSKPLRSTMADLIDKFSHINASLFRTGQVRSFIRRVHLSIIIICIVRIDISISPSPHKLKNNYREKRCQINGRAIDYMIAVALYSYWKAVVVCQLVCASHWKQWLFLILRCASETMQQIRKQYFHCY